MREKICIACKSPLTEKPLMTLDGMPASAQNIPDERGIETDRGISLRLCQCRHCGLVQFDCEPVNYYGDVIRSGGFSTTMVELRRNQYRHLIGKWRLEGKRFLEAGCGQGEFLSVLQEFPVKAYGIENKKELVKLAESRGLLVWRQFADKEDTVLKDPSGRVEGPFDVFLSFNFLEHQPDPVGMLRCLYRNLTEEGMGLLTVPSFEYILDHGGYYELIRDHLAYYTFDTLRYVLDRAGFEVLEEEMVNRDTLSVVVRKKRAGRNGYNEPSGGEDRGKQRQDRPEQTGKKAEVSGLIKSKEIIGREMETLLQELKKEEKSLAVWGASHQGFTLAAAAGLGGRVKYMIDSAPFKQGRFAPASHIPIVPPDYAAENPADAILIVAPGYTEEIAESIRKKMGKTVRILAMRSNHLEELTL